MQNTEIILLAIAAVIGIILFMRVMRTIMRVVFIVAVLGAIVYFWSGRTAVEQVDVSVDTLFDNTTITELMSRHCPPDKLETMRCHCAIVPAYNDFNTRFSPDEISAMQNNRTRLLTETAISLKNTRSEISKCLAEKKDQTVGFFQKIRDIYNLVTQ